MHVDDDPPGWTICLLASFVSGLALLGIIKAAEIVSWLFTHVHVSIA